MLKWTDEQVRLCGLRHKANFLNNQQTMSAKAHTENPKIMVLIPCYREEGAIGSVASDAVALGYDTVVVDDGSDDDTAAEARKAGATVLVHEVNQGKGKALETGLHHAIDNGYDAVVIIDGDGQHLPGEIERFVEAYRDTGADLVIGTRMGDTSNMPFVRRQTNRFMSWLLSRQLGRKVSDTQCGFRMIARSAFPTALSCSSGGFSAESEMLLQLGLADMAIVEVPVSTVYGDEVSKIRPVRDTVRFINMLHRFRRERRARMAAKRREPR